MSTSHNGTIILKSFADIAQHLDLGVWPGQQTRNETHTNSEANSLITTTQTTSQQLQSAQQLAAGPIVRPAERDLASLMIAWPASAQPGTAARQDAAPENSQRRASPLRNLARVRADGRGRTPGGCASAAAPRRVAQATAGRGTDLMRSRLPAHRRVRRPAVARLELGSRQWVRQRAGRAADRIRSGLARARVPGAGSARGRPAVLSARRAIRLASLRFGRLDDCAADCLCEVAVLVTVV